MLNTALVPSSSYMAPLHPQRRLSAGAFQHEMQKEKLNSPWKTWLRPFRNKDSKGRQAILKQKKKRQGSFAMIGEALKGAREEIAAAPSLRERLKLGTSLGSTLVKELLDIALVIPYGLRAFRTYRSLPSATISQADLTGPAETFSRDHSDADLGDLSRPLVSGVVGQTVPTEPATSNVVVTGSALQWLRGMYLRGPAGETFSRGKHGISVVRDVAYGPGERNVLDIYLPAQQSTLACKTGGSPVAFFVHGGVWASGDKWQFSPMASRIAREGVVAVLIHYSLYPAVLAADQVAEASAALTWTMDNIGRYGGDPSRIFIMGHSSGAHVCGMLLWQRAICQHRQSSSTSWPLGTLMSDEVEGISSGAVELSPESSFPGVCIQTGAGEDPRQPYCFLGLSGVYDISEHYAYEVSRGVAAISCMRPANGGPENFAKMSPAVLFGELANRVQAPDAKALHKGLAHVLVTGDSPAGPCTSSIPGDSTPGPASLPQGEDHSEANTAVVAPVIGASPSTNLSGQELVGQGDQGGAAPALTGAVVDANMEEKVAGQSCLVPPCLLLCSPEDIVVPPQTSVMLEDALQRLGCPAKVMPYDGLTHGEFVCWASEAEADKKPVVPYVRDVLNLLTGRMQLASIQWTKK